MFALFAPKIFHSLSICVSISQTFFHASSSSSSLLFCLISIFLREINDQRFFLRECRNEFVDFSKMKIFVKFLIRNSHLRVF